VSDTAVVIDAMVSIESIRVVDRHRRDMGDLQTLADSIADVGLLNPITMTRDSRLIAGQRRLEACRLLDWAAIPVRFVDTLDDATKVLRAERDENVCRKDMLPSELAALGESLYEIEAESARERQRRAGQEHGRGIASGPESGSYEPRGDTRDRVGEALGMAGGTYSKLRFAHGLASNPKTPADERALARDALAEMDRTNTITGPAKRLRAKIGAKHTQVAKAAAEPEPEPDWVPAPNEKGREAVARRRELIAEYGRTGYTSGQIGDRLGILDQTIRRIARDNGITIIADVALGRSHKRIDSNRIIREIVQDLEHTETSISLVDFAELDRAEIKHWTASLSKSIRMLNRLHKQLKETVQ
jgi:hypothetical protein